MAAPAARSVAAMEVPISSSDRINWINITVPSSIDPPLADSEVASAPAIHPNVASCNVILGDPPAYLFWRIHYNLPNVLEVVELFACNDYPETGLHLHFHDILLPFAFLCKNESAGEDAYLLYALTVSGIAYLLKLKRPIKFVSGSIFPQSDLIEISVQCSTPSRKITAVAATYGCLLIGRKDGSVSCYQLGVLEPNRPGFLYELLDDGGLLRLWNRISRGKPAGAVQDLVLSDVYGRKVLFVLHSDGLIRSWDLTSHTRVLSYSMNSTELTGISPSRFWVGSVDYDANMITLAILHVSDIDVIAIYNFGVAAGDKIIFSPESLLRTIPLDKGRFIDLKISSHKLWILKEDGTLFYELSEYDYKVGQASNYGLQEDFVAEELFQSSEHALDDLVWTNTSIFSPMKNQVIDFVSSIFLQRLLQPGVYHSHALRAMLLDQKKYFSDYEFQSLSVADLRKEIFAVIRAEESETKLGSMVYYWKEFCSSYFRYWCQYSVPYGLFFDISNNTLGLIRKSSFSLFRSLEGIEKLIYGCSDEFDDPKSYGLVLPAGNVDNELLYEVLRCTSHINHQMGRAASAIFYASLFLPSLSSEDIIFHLVKVLKTGSHPLPTSLPAQFGVDTTWEKRQAAHRSMRSFSVDMLLSLHALHSRATDWAGVLNVLEKYLEYLKPHRSCQRSEAEKNYCVNFLLLVQATSQVARVMFETAFDVLLLLGYMINSSGLVSMNQDDITRIKVNLIPMTYEILMQWLVLHFLGTTPTSPTVMDDFSSRLSSLHIGSKAEKKSWVLGSIGCTLAFLLDFPSCSEGEINYLKSFLSSDKLIQSVWKFSSMILWGVTGKESSVVPTIKLCSLLLSHGQYEAAEILLLIIDDLSAKRKLSQSSWHADANWCRSLHLLGFCLVMRAQSEVDEALKEHKIDEAVRCFFRAASLPEACQCLQTLSSVTGFLFFGEIECTALWKFQYFHWTMQLFDQYLMNNGACQFALAALEQVDEIMGLKDEKLVGDIFPESASTIRGQLWANVFKFSLDLKNFGDAYCAIISNPDDDSKYICLRRFIIVLCEQGATKVICDGKLPFVGMTEKVEQELFWKAERSDIFASPNVYKLLYSFEAYRNNWRKAASYIYQYSIRLKNEVNVDDTGKFSEALRARLEGLSAAINALQLVDNPSGWIESRCEDSFSITHGLPHKRARNFLTVESAPVDDSQYEMLQKNADVEMLEKEYLLTLVQYLMSHINYNIQISGNQKISKLVSMLVSENFNDLAFTVILKLCKGSTLNRELEQAFIILAEKCLFGGKSTLPFGGNVHNFLLPSHENATSTEGIITSSSVINQIEGSGHWETLEFYLEKYRKLHPRLPVVVAETLLSGNSQIELPFWLLHMFKIGQRATPWGMTGHQPDPATLLRLYVDYGRLPEATNLLLEYLESFANLSPADAIKRKKMSAIWFPYTAIERLWCQLEELRGAGHLVEQCEKLKNLLQGALLNHLKQVKLDSDDAVAAAQMPNSQIVLD